MSALTRHFIFLHIKAKKLATVSEAPSAVRPWVLRYAGLLRHSYSLRKPPYTIRVPIDFSLHAKASLVAISGSPARFKTGMH